MKKIIPYLPYFFYVLGFISFILPVVYFKEDDVRVNYNMLELIFGKESQDLSIGLLIVLLMFLLTITFSITINIKTSKILENITIILGLATGVLLFFARLLSNPSTTTLNVHIGLILPGVFVILGTIIIFINKKIMTLKKDEL